MRREDAIKNELKKLHTVYVAPYQYDLRVELDPISNATVFKTRKAARKYVREMLGVDHPDDFIRKLDFEF